MKLRKILALCILVALMMPTTRNTRVQAATEPTRAETLIFQTNSAIVNLKNFNPLIPDSNRDRGMIQGLTEPLFILDYNTGKIKPWLGLSFEPNATQDVWTLKLRDGVMWQDGVPFTADDVVFTINLLKNGAPTLGDSGPMAEWVKTVEKVDKLTVKFTLTKSNPRFQLDYFSVKVSEGLIILPEHVWKDKDPKTFLNYDPQQGWPLGTGPYKLSKVTETDVIWDRDDNWWGVKAGFSPALPAPKRLIFSTILTEEAESAAIINNDIDMGASLSSVGTMDAIKARNPKVTAWYDDLPYAWGDPCPRQLTLNTTVSPWDNKVMRQALNLIIDRNQIVKIAYEGANKPSRSPFVEYNSMQPFIKALVDGGVSFSPTADLKAARALIEGAGYTLKDNVYQKDGKSLSLKLLAHESIPDMRSITDVLVEQLRQAGIDASQEVLAGGTWWTDINAGQFDGFVSWMPCGSINEPWATLDWANAKWIAPVGQPALNSSNMGRWKNDKYSAIIDEVGKLPLGDPAAATKIVDAMKIWWDEMPIIPLVQSALIIPTNTTYWTNWPSAANPYSTPTLWWQSAEVIFLNLKPAAQ